MIKCLFPSWTKLFLIKDVEKVELIRSPSWGEHHVSLEGLPGEAWWGRTEQPWAGPSAGAKIWVEEEKHSAKTRTELAPERERREGKREGGEGDTGREKNFQDQWKMGTWPLKLSIRVTNPWVWQQFGGKQWKVLVHPGYDLEQSRDLMFGYRSYDQKDHEEGDLLRSTEITQGMLWAIRGCDTRVLSPVYFDI